MFYTQSGGVVLYADSDSDWGGALPFILITTGHVFYLGSTALTSTSKTKRILSLFLHARLSMWQQLMVHAKLYLR